MILGIIIVFLLFYFEIGFILAICCAAGNEPWCGFPWRVVLGWGFRFLGEKIYDKIV
jgi:hypothetical protein